MLFVFGILAVLFALLAVLNVLNVSSEHKLLLSIQKNHKIFGMLASLSGIIHLVIVITNSQFRVTGAIALLVIILTGVFGLIFNKTKEKWAFITHKGCAMGSLVLILLHIIFNSSF